MIICRTPLRISFFGGGTDYPAWYLENGGKVLATTIDKYSYITARWLPPFFEHKNRIVYSKIECVKDVKDIEHPAVRAILRWMNVTEGIEIHYDGDVPARSGLGTSSAFTVGLINTLNSMDGLYISKEALSSHAIEVEQKILNENVGSQDQICAAFGGFNRIEFKQSGQFDVRPVITPKKKLDALEESLMLYFTGFQRIADPVAKTVIENIKDKPQLEEMAELVDEAIDSIGDISYFGKLLDTTWKLKKTLSPLVSNSKIDAIYDKAIGAGAHGGKLLGAGNGGFLLLCVDPELQWKVKEALSPLIHVPFRFENTGSKIVLYQPNGLS